jgi:hypothetical protein
MSKPNQPGQLDHYSFWILGVAIVLLLGVIGGTLGRIETLLRDEIHRSLPPAAHDRAHSEPTKGRT